MLYPVRTGYALANHDITDGCEKFYEDRCYEIEIDETFNSVEVVNGRGDRLYYSNMEEFLEDFRII